LDDDGDLWVLDRRSDLIVSGGENVYPAELERMLREYPGVSQVCVVGLPHPDWGQQVTAIIVPHAPERFDEDDLLAFSRERLAGYKQPR
ncbi:AMP-binding enzyme, partial [Streptococcus pyogenes]